MRFEPGRNTTRTIADEQVIRVAENEAAFRRANEKLRAVFAQREGPAVYPFLCECGNRSCTTVVEVGLEVYARIRAEPVRFLIAPGHKQLESEQLVETGEGYDVVEKTGEAGEIARTRWLAQSR